MRADIFVTTEEPTLKILQYGRKVGLWNGTLERRKGVFRKMFGMFKSAYPDLKGYTLCLTVGYKSERSKHSFGSYCDYEKKRIVLRGKLSVITFLHEIAHALFPFRESESKWGEDYGFANEAFAEIWSNVHFYQVFPEKMGHRGKL